MEKKIQKVGYDKRLTDWEVRTGQLTEEQIKKNLAELPDLKDNVLYVNLEGERSRSEAH